MWNIYRHLIFGFDHFLVASAPSQVNTVYFNSKACKYTRTWKKKVVKIGAHKKLLKKHLNHPIPYQISGTQRHTCWRAPYICCKICVSNIWYKLLTRIVFTQISSRLSFFDQNFNNQNSLNIQNFSKRNSVKGNN